MTTQAERLTASSAPMQRREVVAHSVAFIIGFTLIFVAAGASASAIGQLLSDYRTIITRLLGIVVIVLGLNMVGLFKLPFLAMDKRVRVNKGGVTYLGSTLVGIAFAAGWSPCIGPILAAVLALASVQKTVAAGTALLLVYSLGLALPFLATALALQYVLPALGRVKRFLPVIDAVAGVIVIGTGLVLVTNSFLRFTAWLYQTFPALQNVGTGPEASSDAISIGATFIAGLVSFISPCVLPLVPAYISFMTGQSIESLVASYQRRPATPA